MSGAKKSANSSSKKPGPRQQPKVFDIRRPGKALASPTSRPVITPPKVKDSVLTNKPAPPKTSSKPVRIASNPNDERDLMDPTKKVTIQPADAKVDAPTIPAKPIPQPDVAADVPKPSTPPTQPVPAAAMIPEPAPKPDATEHVNDPNVSNDPSTQPTATAVENKPAPSPLQQLQSDLAATINQATPVEETPQQQLQPQPATPQHEPQNSEEVLAGTTPPEVDMSRAVISPHLAPRRHVWREVLTVIGLLLFVVAIADVLLDAGIFHVHGIPHTNLWNS
ncbi:MAG TPA: hypothetical protein VIM53_00340 [Candidatus Saccharimonadales bacterium]